MNAVVLRASRVVVGIADARVSADPTQELVTHALGSCVGVVVYDPVAKVAGLLHAMLPDGTSAPHKVLTSPAMFVETGVPLLVDMALRLGAMKTRLVVRAAGGAHVTQVAGAQNLFKIGERNVTALRRALWKAGLLLAANDCGGSISRTVVVSVATGETTLSGEGGKRKL